MGVLFPKCITLSGSRFIGMSYTFPTPEDTQTSYNRRTESSTYVALIQSNQYPENLLDLTWSLVSIWPRDTFYKSDTFSSLSCHSDPISGVFTMMSNFSGNNASPEYPPDSQRIRQPGGIQYNPTNNQWSEFGLSPGYLWGNVSATFDLFSWPGTSTLYQVNIGKVSTGLINLGMLPDDSAVTLTPVSKSSLIQLSQFKDGDKGLSSPSSGAGPGIDNLIQPIEQDQGSGSSSLPWIFMGNPYGLANEITIDPFGNPQLLNNPRTYIYIKEPYGLELPDFTPYDDSVNNTPAITAGIVVGVMVILAAVLYLPVRRRLPGWREKWAFFKAQTWPRWKRRVRLKLIEILRDDNDTNNKSHDEEALAGKTVISKDGGADVNEFNNKFEEHRMTSLDLEGCDKILVTDDMDLSSLSNMPAMDVATGYMNGVRLETHPRPGVVTTLTGSANRSHGSSSSSSSSKDGESTLDDIPPQHLPPQPPGHMLVSLVVPSAPSTNGQDENGSATLLESPRAPHSNLP
ncbi:hypothetical protein EC991_006454 [Linnemannia zychae]|nr:hypothetical protein EC991_006454 [Linnemannia zychae]